MNETPFFKTRMGQRFYEQTMPELVKQLERVGDILERLLTWLEERDQEGPLRDSAPGTE